MTERFGETPAEAEAREMLRCRQIASEIVKFGVSQREILRVMHLLSLELEDRDLMVDLSERIKGSLSSSTGALSGRIIET